MFINIPTFPPNAHGAPDTLRKVQMTVAVSAIALLSTVEVPSSGVAGLNRPATVIGLIIPGQSLITPLEIEEVLALIDNSSLASLRKFN